MVVRWSGMRVVALPLANGSNAKLSKEILPLTYYHFHTPPPDEKRPTPIFNRITNKTADIWANFGNAHEKSWKVGFHSKNLLGRLYMYRDYSFFGFFIEPRPFLLL